MSESEKIKLAIERSSKALTLKPSLGRRTATSKVRIKDGLTCEVEEGKWKFYADMPESVGGNDEAPRPGVYGRVALGSCLAIVYKMTAAKMDVPLRLLEVEVQTDSDEGGLLGTADVYPGYAEVRYKVTIESEASEEAILKMLDDADRHSPYLDIFSRGLDCKRELNIISSKIQP